MTDTDSDAPDTPDLCFISEEAVLSEKVIPGEQALETIKHCSIERGDGKHSILTAGCKVVVHRTCRNTYTKPSLVKKEKRSTTLGESSFSPKRWRSSGIFYFDGNCFFVATMLLLWKGKTQGKCVKWLTVISKAKFKRWQSPGVINGDGMWMVGFLALI